MSDALAAAGLVAATALLTSLLNFIVFSQRLSQEGRLRVIELEYRRVEQIVERVLAIQWEFLRGGNWPIQGMEASNLRAQASKLRNDEFWFIGNPNAIAGLRDFRSHALSLLDAHGTGQVDVNELRGSAITAVKGLVDSCELFQVGARQQMVPWGLFKASEKELRKLHKQIGYEPHR